MILLSAGSACISPTPLLTYLYCRLGSIGLENGRSIPSSGGRFSSQAWRSREKMGRRTFREMLDRRVCFDRWTGKWEGGGWRKKGGLDKRCSGQGVWKMMGHDRWREDGRVRDGLEPRPWTCSNDLSIEKLRINFPTIENSSIVVHQLNGRYFFKNYSRKIRYVLKFSLDVFSQSIKIP